MFVMKIESFLQILHRSNQTVELKAVISTVYIGCLLLEAVETWKRPVWRNGFVNCWKIMLSVDFRIEINYTYNGGKPFAFIDQGDEALKKGNAYPYSAHDLDWDLKLEVRYWQEVHPTTLYVSLDLWHWTCHLITTSASKPIFPTIKCR